MTTTSLAGPLARIRQRIDDAATRSGRRAADVTLVAVTKGHPFHVVEYAREAGITDLAENRVESLLERVPRLATDPDVRWHMVGRLQRRKAPEVRGLVHLLQSLDSVRLAQRLHRTAGEDDPVLPVLVQVNTSGEDQKAGFSPENVVERVGEVLELGSLQVEGLMTMAPFTDDEAVLRDTFGGLRRCHEELDRQLDAYRGKILSMGMSNDYEIAIEEGSTMIRLGTALFGERPR
ncbi:MAG: YggS family pyridoxal phosphate-dependent enzyme [Gemmatimonadales bacterium]|nr:MAG: YggS family pyridoxal phosphate-dependent enzyme [Gemmatimonadales bacterium]